ncbi:HD domain-containing protein [Streptohalobacillus salinus]|uniref:HD domain-containing protein n=1 Tax=Streptohalobacillus salinus TaxID=621096 RepID=A0A2V3W4F2_9BACI|nr:HD domain-containing protein [Streptohalobacillus salinus]PXW89177.1 HD domain-containing protein [Streptohalobacillus salinus]
MIRSGLMRAITYASTKHRNQVRKVDHTPFIAHPYRVCMLLKEHQVNEDIAVAALLHDVVEDTDATLEEIEQIFGDTVRYLVSEVTETDKEIAWVDRKKQSIKKVSHCDYAVKLLVAADKIDNLQSMIDAEMVHGPSMWESFVGSREEQVWYYQSMFESITHDLADDQWHPLFYLFQALLDKFTEGTYDFD